jgi:hypothetical protein
MRAHLEHDASNGGASLLGRGGLVALGLQEGIPSRVQQILDTLIISREIPPMNSASKRLQSPHIPLYVVVAECGLIEQLIHYVTFSMYLSSMCDLATRLSLLVPLQLTLSWPTHFLSSFLTQFLCRHKTIYRSARYSPTKSSKTQTREHGHSRITA